MAKKQAKTHGGKRKGAGRPREYIEGASVVALYLPRGLMVAVEREAYERGKSRSAVIADRLLASYYGPPETD